MSDQDETVQLTVQRTVLPSARPPQHAQKFAYTRAGDQIALDVGYFDFRETFEFLRISEAESPSKKDLPRLYISNTFVLSVPAALELFAVSQAIVEDLRTHGFIQEEEDKENSNAKD